MSDLQFVKLSWDGDLAIVTVDRQEKLNALNAAVILELGEVFDGLRGDTEVHGVVLTGAGEKAFVAGADIGELVEMTAVSGLEVSRRGQGVFRSIERFPKPVVAAVGGYALGAGLELAMACHLRVASETARFGLPEVGLGIIPGYGGTVRLARLVGLGRALEMTLSGDMVDAARAESFGLVNQVVASEDLLATAKAKVRAITKNGPLAVRMALEAVYRAQDLTLAEALGVESSFFGLLSATDDMTEGMTAFLEKRKAEFKGR